ncbi:MAG: hypothetical protein ACI8QQ_002757, partial [Psychroserpens sp.]
LKEKSMNSKYIGIKKKGLIVCIFFIIKVLK